MENFLKTFDLTVLDAQMILLWAGCFIILWQILSKVVFARFIRLVEARDAATIGAQSTVKQMLEEAQSLKLKNEDQLTEVRVDAMKTKLAELSRARTQAQQIIEDAERGAQAGIARAREELTQKLNALRSELDRESDELARSLVAKVKTNPDVRVH